MLNKVKKRILFAGAYGIENAGDDLPLIVICEQLRERMSNVDFEFRALSRHPNSWEEKKYGVTMIKNLEYESRDEAQGKWFKGLNVGDDKSDIIRIKREIQRCDLLVLGAGNFLIDIAIDIFRGPIPLMALYVFLAKMYHRPVMLYGLSAGPLKTEWGRDLSRWLVENSDIVTVRDENSKQLLKNLINIPKTIHLLPDATIGAEMIDSKKIENNLFQEGIRISENKNTIAIGLRDLSVVLPSNQAEESWKQIAGYMNLLKDQASFLFIPQSTYKEDDDRLTAKRFIPLLDSSVEYHIIQNRYDPRELIGFYSVCHLTIAIRLHAAVFSTIAGTPVIAVNYLPKVEGFMKGIDADYNLIQVDNIKAEYLMNLTKNNMEEKEKISKKIRKKIKIKKESVNQYIDLAISVLNGKASQPNKKYHK